MKITWYGHASFRLTADDGTTLITDPYTPETSGYMPVPETADIVIISSDNDRFHCRADLVPGTPLVINALTLAREGGVTIQNGIEIRAIEAMEALDHEFHDPDQNGMYRMVVNGVHIGHMGDMGNALTPAQLDFFQDVDILFALAGGHPTIELEHLKTLIDSAQPKWVIPMHFRTLRYKPRNTFWIERFLGYFPDEAVDFACDHTVEITREGLPASTRALILTHAL